MTKFVCPTSASRSEFLYSNLAEPTGWIFDRIEKSSALHQSRYAAAMVGGSHPALFLFERIFLDPLCVLCAAVGGLALVHHHWISAALLFAGALLLGWLARGLFRSEKQTLPAIPESLADEADPEDAQELARAIVRANIVLSLVLFGLVWSERYPLLHASVFVVLFSILFPAAAALACLGGERCLRAGDSGIRGGPPPFRGTPHPH